MKRIILIILSVLMVMSTFAACAKSEDADHGTDSSSSLEETKKDNEETDSSGEESSETLSEKELIGIPEDIDFGKKEVNIIGWNCDQPEYYVDDENMDGSPINDAIYKKNLYTEQTLKVKLNYTIVDGAGNDTDIVNWCDTVKNMMNDPNTPVDIFSCYSRTVATATINGLNQDLTPFTNLDLSKEWWPKNVQNEFMIGDKLFFITGDISTNVLHMMYGVFYNADLAKQYGLEDPVTLVKSRDWTIDKWIEMTSDIYRDTDGETGKSKGDFFGVGCQYFHLDSLIQGAGFKIVESTTEDDKYLSITDDFFSEKFGNFVDKITAWTNSDGFYNDVAYEGITEEKFLEGNCIFKIHPAMYGFSIQATDIEYGIVPPPLLDKSQDEYKTSLANPYSIYSVCRNTNDGERAAAVLQTLGYYAKKHTTPAIFDITFKVKFAKREEVSDMFNIIREGVGFDLGILYMKRLAYICDMPTHEAISANKSWKLYMDARKQDMLVRLMNKLNKDLSDVAQAS